MYITHVECLYAYMQNIHVCTHDKYKMSYLQQVLNALTCSYVYVHSEYVYIHDTYKISGLVYMCIYTAYMYLYITHTK